MDVIRAFVAVPLPGSLLDELANVQRRLKGRVPDRSVRWVRPEGIHLTLKFLGDTPVDKLEQIKQALTAVARNAPSCGFTVGGLGCFPNPRRPRVVWVGVQEPSGRLAAVQDAVEEVLAPLGYEPEGRGFKPHLTLGRIGRKTSRGDAALVGEVVAGTDIGQLAEVAVEEFDLIRSVLKPTGAEYTTLAEFPLLGGPR
jgi:2'-5' RNA ligase